MTGTDRSAARRDTLEGVKNALPIFIGYFTTSVAFGLLAVSSGLTPFEAVLFSMTNLTGAAQFMAINLMSAGAAAGEIIISVMLMNLRYFIMSASLARRIGFDSVPGRMIAAFGVTDEIFSVASLRKGVVSLSFFFGLESFAWLGWASGTLAGVTLGSFLPSSLQDAMSGALFALFAALLVPEIKKGLRPIFLAASAGGMNTFLFYKLHISAGWSIVISMLSVTALAALIFSDNPDIERTESMEAGSE